MRQLVYQVCYTRHHVSFYLWLIGSVLKYCKVLKYYGQDCRLLARLNNFHLMQNSSLFYQGYVMRPPSVFKMDIDHNSDASPFAQGKVKRHVVVRYRAIDIAYGSKLSNSIQLLRCC